MMVIRQFSIVCFIFVIASAFMQAQESVINGVVHNAKTKEIIPGASLRVTATNKGTYTGAKGTFKLRVKGSESVKVLVKCIGYESKEVEMSPLLSPVTVELNPAVLSTEEVVVSAPDVNGIIRKAIERKKANIEKIRTLKALLYSKLTTEAKGIGMGTGSGSGNSFSFSAGLDAGKDTSAFVLETFSEMYFDYPNKRSSNTIIQRRQTKNIDASNNTLAFGRFINLYENDISIFNVSMESPLSDDAFDTYRYSLEDRQKLGDKFVYVIKVIPLSKLQPAFQGTIKIIDGTFNLIEADIKPSASTAIPFITNLHFVQKFDQISPEIWHPTFLKTSGTGKGVGIKGLFELELDIEATTIITDAFPNIIIPDSVFEGKRVKVAKNADTLNNEFWQKNSLEELSDKEKSFYDKAEKEIKQKDTVQGNQSEFGKITDVGLRLDFNRISGVTTGLNILFKKYDFAHFEVSPAYSWALKKPLITVGAKVFMDSSHKTFFFVSGFSEMERVGHDRSISTVVNSIGAFVLGDDYYDWFKKDGWSAGAQSEYKGVKASLSFTESRQFTDTLKVKRSLFTGTEWRRNPPIDNGNYRVLEASIGYGDVNPFSSGKWQFSAEIRGLFGLEVHRSTDFTRAEIKLQSMMPLISTGYTPMTLRLGVNAGIANGDVPFQYRFRLQNALKPIAPFGNMLSAETGKYGGTEFFHLQAEFNTTDLWWRVLDLPLYEGRGLDLIIAGGNALIAKNNADSRYKTTQTQHYSEIGFGLGRIPVFFSNVIFLRFDARWGIGPFASGRFGWGGGITLPF